MASPTIPIIGLYGIPGCGKSHLLGQLPKQLGTDNYSYYEGSSVIASIVPGGLAAFHASTENEKNQWRKTAINKIRDDSASAGTPAVVAGHFMFWSEGEDIGQVVCTSDDISVYTHIVYLEIPIATIASQRDDDRYRRRPFQSESHLRKWQEAEKTQLRKICMDNDILFISLRNTDMVPAFIRSFARCSYDSNMALAKARLERFLHHASLPRGGQIKTVLVLDADRTLSPNDTGSLFWRILGGTSSPCPLKTIFSSPMGYSFAAFNQARLAYQEIVHNESEENLSYICNQVAQGTHLYSEFTNLLRTLDRDDCVLPIVITCGLGQIWETVLRDALGQGRVDVVGTDTSTEGLIVTPEVKADLVSYLRQVHSLRVWAVGDSPLDLPMMMKAHQAVVVVGHESVRSKTMDSALEESIDHKGLRAVQILLPSDEATKVKPRLDTSKLPVVSFTGRDLLDHLARNPEVPLDQTPYILHATDKPAAKLLMTPTRDANLAGPVLREAHRQVGRYLALEFVGQMVGLEVFDIPHVQNRRTKGYRLRSENKTTIVALMRGGDPMAQGVSDVFPLAMFVHAKEATDLKEHHITGQDTVILVDSVINSGKSVVEFVERIRSFPATNVLVLVIAGVAQSGSVRGEGSLAKYLERDGKLRLVALRLSENKYTGHGGTDTGNRLFNTTHLD